MELVDPWIPEKGKKRLIGAIALGVGITLAWAAELRVLEPLGIADAEVADIAVTALVVSAGTEGFNSIMKFLGYKKEEKKAEATAATLNIQREDMATLQQQV